MPNNSQPPFDPNADLDIPPDPLSALPLASLARTPASTPRPSARGHTMPQSIQNTQQSLYNDWRHSQGLTPLPISGPKSIRTFSLSQAAYQGLLALAEEHHTTYNSRLSVSAFLEMLGQGMFVITQPPAPQTPLTE